ncbi:hypothetical protein E3A20_13820 [Planctomyces bekefii]|uniref:DUF1552 domain-containing protein n=1 Tax=Planctomyces bekefii TaxID=1653850 RepID=A0A5C6M454_9PLAN|nr:hypothetical protein E3A20_13820 [Planctomyces bekefii]
MKHDRYNRRSLLQGVGGTLLSIPYLASLAEDRAFGQALPEKLTRFVGLYWPYGSYSEVFYPNPTADSLAINYGSHKVTALTDLGTISPAFDQVDFAAIKAKATILRGLDFLGYHNHYPSTFLSGTAHVGVNIGASPYTESIDQLMARKIYTEIPQLPYLALGQVGSASISYAHSGGTTTPLPYLSDAAVAYDYVTSRILTGATPADIAALRAKKQSLIDMVKADFNDVLASTSKISAADRHRLETTKLRHRRNHGNSI